MPTLFISLKDARLQALLKHMEKVDLCTETLIDALLETHSFCTLYRCHYRDLFDKVCENDAQIYKHILFEERIPSYVSIDNRHTIESMTEWYMEAMELTFKIYNLNALTPDVGLYDYAQIEGNLLRIEVCAP